MPQVTETKNIKIDHACKSNPVYIKWLGTKGGWNYWLFHAKQSVKHIVSGGETFKRYVEDLEASQGDTDWISKDAHKELNVGDDNLLSEDIFFSDEYPGLTGLRNSIKVQILTSVSPAKWMTVLVAPGSFNTIETDDKRSSIEVTLIFPEINIQTQ